MRFTGLLIPLLFSQLCLCQTSTNQPSLEVTMNWLTTNLLSARSEVVTETIPLDKNGKPKNKVKKDTIDAVILTANANGCDLTLRTQVKWNLDLVKTSIETIPLGRITATMEPYTRENPDKSTHRMTFNPPSVLHIYLTAPSALIRGSVTTHLIDNSVSDTTTTLPATRTAIELDDAQLAPRLLKALQHASQLCQSTVAPEPF
jgi:hypothetical protein